MIRLWLLIAICSCMAFGCGRGPAVEDLVAQVQARLDSQFEQDLFHVASFERRGSAPFHNLERDISGVFVYYDANLELQRDYDLSSWRGLNVGTLSYVLGSTPSGVTGFRPNGNARGDLLRVHGRLAWEQQDGEWRAIVSEPIREQERAAAPAEGVSPASLLETIRKLVTSRPTKPPEDREAATVHELRRAVEEIDLRFARLDGAYVLGTGQTPGTYAAFGKGFAQHATARGLPLHAHPSAGSVENGMRIQEREFDFALIQSDVAEVLYEGVKDGRIPLPDIRAVASLWPEAVHIVTFEGSEIRYLADLSGKRIAMGNVGSGTRLNAVEIGRVAGMTRDDFPEILETSVARSIRALESGEVDAIFITEAVPSRAIQDLVRRREDVRFVGIEEPMLERLSADHFAYYGLTVPARTYPGQELPFRTLALAASLVARVDTPDDVVARVLTMLIDEAHDLSQFDYRAAFISTDTMRLGIALPLHSAAERFYRERERDSDAEVAPSESPTVGAIPRS